MKLKGRKSTGINNNLFACPRTVRWRRLHSVSGGHGLPKTQSTVSGRYFVLRKHLESSGGQLGLESPAEISIVEGPAA